MGTSQKILETYAKKTSLKNVCFRKICKTWWISLTSRLTIEWEILKMAYELRQKAERSLTKLFVYGCA